MNRTVHYTLVGGTLFFGSVALALAFVFLPLWSGDGLIHLSLIENASHGRWFQFNAGVPDAASSSPLWMVLGASLWRVGGVQCAVYGLKALSVAAWVGVAVLTYSLVRQAGAGPWVCRFAAALAVALPGSAMNALEGMEGGLFAALVLGGVLLLARFEQGPSPPTLADVAALFGVLGLSCATRPEGFIVAFILGLAALRAGSRFGARERRRVLLGVPLVAALALPLWLYSYRLTGQLVPTAGLSRVMSARRQPTSLSVAGIWFYAAPLLRLAVYAPLTVLGVLAGAQRPKPAEHVALFRSMVVLVSAGAAAYAFVFGTEQTARYLIWLFALLVPLSCITACRWFERRNPGQVRLLVAGLIWMTVLVAGEAWVRATRYSNSFRTREVLAGARTRSKRTDEMLRSLCAHGCCSAQPVRLAAFEVESRFFLDDRIQIVSMDGVTIGPFDRPVRYRPDGCPRIDSLLSDKRIVALQEDPTARLPGCGTLSPTGWSQGDEMTAFIRECPPSPVLP